MRLLDALGVTWICEPPGSVRAVNVEVKALRETVASAVAAASLDTEPRLVTPALERAIELLKLHRTGHPVAPAHLEAVAAALERAIREASQVAEALREAAESGEQEA